MKKIIISTIVLIILLMNTLVYATGFNLNNVINGGKVFSNSAISNAGDVNGQFSGLIKGLAQAGLAIGTIIAIAGGIVISIKLMSDGANGKAELKESLTPYLIGCVVLFGAFGIWTATVNIMQGTFITNAPGGGGGGVTPPVVTPPVVTPSASTPVNEQQLVEYLEFIANSGDVDITIRDSDKTIITNGLDEYSNEKDCLNIINILCDEENGYGYTHVGH